LGPPKAPPTGRGQELPNALAALLPDTAAATTEGHLTLAGVDVVDLAERFGTPLYVYDEASIRRRARAYREGLAAAYGGASLVCYAGKAYCAPWLLKLLDEEGLGLDVVSGGELFTASFAGFPAKRIYFHGNNKSEAELIQALDAGVGRIVVDNEEEIGRLSRLCAARGIEQAILLRVAPSVEAHTHEHIMTGALDTKFGLNIETGAAAKAAELIQNVPGLRLLGLHAHIGSQIFELEPYQRTIERVFELAAQLRERRGFQLNELSPGGGFGMRYVLDGDEPPGPERSTRAVAEAVSAAADRFGFSELPALTIEPGRSIVGPAAVAVYRVGSIKEIAGVRTYVAIDGGMADNIRPTAYGARYTPLLGNRVFDDRSARVAVAGRYCESGDVLVKDALLPPPRLGDVVCVPSSGAYHLAMASNYNLVPRPAVVVVKDGAARLVRRRETYQDLLRTEL
jgi:diaminopimelate decarboxylase